MKKKSEKIISGVAFDPDVTDYLEELSEREDRSRSWLINTIIREHAKQHGQAKSVSKRAPRK
jgi:predicted transcriptional regulator